MDYGDLLQAHLQKGADITLATTPVDRAAASGFGILHSSAKRHIFRFEEKPKEPELLDELRIPPELLKELGHPADAELYQGSMGIYVFNRQVLIDALANDRDDFGKHIIPASLQKYQVFAHIFQGYWEDVGTVRAFFETNLALTDPVPAFNFFDRINPIYTQQRSLPASKLTGTQVQRAIIADGCVITDAHIDRAVIGIRSVIESGTTIHNSVLMGADFYQAEAGEPKPGIPPLGIGRRCHIEGAIIDKNACIGEEVVITPKGKSNNVDSENYCIREGVVVVPKGAVIPAGTLI
jgi:glucose-1-phosphate adenylyltransferase